MELIVPEHVFARIQDIVNEKPGLETGVVLFGVYVSTARARESFENRSDPPAVHPVVLAASGPGPRATHASAHYAPDNDYANTVYEALANALPGIQWIGELHVHPPGMPRLSGGDLETIREVFHGASADTIRPDRLVAGVIQRRKDGVDIYPFSFTRECLEGAPMGITRVRNDHELLRSARTQACDGAARRVAFRNGADSEEPDPGIAQDSARWPRTWLMRRVKTPKRRNG